jgi:hydrogenase nickel incorporation protein HypB
MCGTCGCSRLKVSEPVRLEPGWTQKQYILLGARVLGKNERLAEQNRERLRAQRILALNLVSSPGAGKTTLLERTLEHFHGQRDVFVIEGDQQGELDAERLRRYGQPVVQINTGSGCHLDAAQVKRGLDSLPLTPDSLLFIENVGNLVCPALFDLGEALRVVVASTPEGDDKPRKYPHMFRSADLVLLNKCDLLPHTSFRRERFLELVQAQNPRAPVIECVATRASGISAWLEWLSERGASPWPTTAAP